MGLDSFKNFVLSSVVLMFLPAAAPISAQTTSDSVKHGSTGEEFRYGRGFIPPEEVLPHLGRKPRPDLVQAEDLPARWDWREHGGVTPVRDQLWCGSCYAFAAIGNIESALMIRGEGKFNLSENNVKECTWEDPSCSGGYYHTIASYLAQKGTVLDQYDLYIPEDVECDYDGPYEHTLLDWRIASQGAVPDPILLKQYIYEYGPIQSVVYSGSWLEDPNWFREFQEYDGSYTLYMPYTWGGVYVNHAILIIGWDDSLIHEGGSGAWIVKNSWGTAWGGTCGYGTEKGYFTIAYGSALIGEYSSFIQDWKEYDPDERLLCYDEAYPRASYGFDDVTAWGLCAFTQPYSCTLTRVEFWTTDLTTDIDIYVYDDFDGNDVSNLLTSKLDVTYAEAGYHSVELDSVLEIEAGNDFFVVVKITNDDYLRPLRWDQWGPIDYGMTFASPTGTPGTWIDMTSNRTGYMPGDLGIRARVLVGEIPPSSEPVPYAYELSNAYPNPFNSGTTIAYSLEHGGQVELTIYNLLGQKVRTLVNGEKAEGSYTVVWDGLDKDGEAVASGVYLYRLRAGDFIEAKKVMLLK